MQKFIVMVCIMLSLALFACHSSSETNNNSDAGFTGNFLAWTGSEDATHYFTLVRVNGQTGSVTTIGGSDFFTGLAYGADGRLYGVSDRLCIINPADGTTSTVGDLISQGTVTPILMTEAAFAPDGTLFVIENASPNRVFTVDLSTGGLTLMGTPDFLAIARAIEFSTNGTLYAAFADLYTLNASNMTTTSTLGSTGAFIEALTFGSGGILYGSDAFPSTNIYSLNLITGQAGIVTAVTSSALVSLVAERTTTVPSAALFQDKVANRPTASFQDVESLLNMENEIKNHHFMSK